VENGKALAIPFKKNSNVRYQCVKLVGDEVASHAFVVGLGKVIKTSNVLSIEEKKMMLLQNSC